MKSQEQILTELNGYYPKEDEWEDLDELIAEASYHPGKDTVKALLQVFERFPEHDGYGVFWAIVHTLEGIGNYESELVKSILRHPHEMSVLMLNRLINGGVREIDGKPIIDILNEVAVNSSFPNEIREKANHFIEYQQSRT